MAEAELAGIAVPRTADAEVAAGSVMIVDSTTVGRPSGPTTVCVMHVAMFEGDSVKVKLTPVPLTSDATPLSVEMGPLPAGATVRVTVWVAKIVRETVEYSRDEISDVV